MSFVRPLVQHAVVLIHFSPKVLVIKFLRTRYEREGDTVHVNRDQNFKIY